VLVKVESPETIATTAPQKLKALYSELREDRWKV
jgi:hypothetical protein